MFKNTGDASPSMHRHSTSASAPPSASTRLIVAAVAIAVTACGVEPDTHPERGTPGSGPAAAHSTEEAIGRWRVEAVRLGVNRPLFVLSDSATGAVLTRDIMGKGGFKPISLEPAPGLELGSENAGRFKVSVVPGRGGAALLRLDTVSGRIWSLQLRTRNRIWEDYSRATGGQRQTKVSEAKETAPARVAKSGPGNSKKVVAPKPKPRKTPLKPLLEVVNDPDMDLKFRVWTGGILAGEHPGEAIKSFSHDAVSSQPELIATMISALKLGSNARLRSKLEPFANHENPLVASAAKEKLGSGN